MSETLKEIVRGRFWIETETQCDKCYETGICLAADSSWEEYEESSICLECLNKAFIELSQG